MELENISFGDRVAENESRKLISYFVKTQHWNAVYKGDVDIVFGAKGSGKSALYTLLLSRADEFKKNGIILISAEKPTGKTVFSDIIATPPTRENEFITLWKTYFCQLIVGWLIDNKKCHDEADDIAEILKGAGLLEETRTLARFINSAKEFASRLLNPQSLEGTIDTTGSVTGKITFNTPTEKQRGLGYKSLDELLESLNKFLLKNKLDFWLLCDRLDVAFDESLDLEKNALRALFKVYRDIEEHEKIHLKIFLRDDIWKRITNEGFREASHITRTTTISWNTRNLMNLIVIRALENQEIIKKYNINPDEVKSDYDNQTKLYYDIFPKQVDVGEKQSDTFDWILNRVRDGLSKVAPRELIHYYNEIISQELRERDINNNKAEPPNMVSRAAIKNSAFEVSRARIEQTIFAEYSNYKDCILKLESSKAEHNLKTLSTIFGTNDKETKEIGSGLAEIGFFDLNYYKNDGLFKIPFLYRFYLKISQGKAF
ncbi:hypothetical protein PTR34_21315 [Serratia nevei]|uniref:P-loop ATPase, Sll1717 family n=1 Tax=Serratia TaxID=613 RepID=UPI00217995AA|nr:hypothetical protein [Serratia marcescens]CAI1791120.1 Uncharacterised protein [Serratia marcescens]